MLLQINGIGNQKIQYKDHKDIGFDSLGEYLLLAKKSISKFANRIFTGLSKKMLNDEDAVSSIANAIMMADWRWDQNYQNHKGTKKTQYSYRNQCAIWAIQTYATKMYKKPKKINKVYSLDYEADNFDSLSIHDCLEDTSSSAPDDIMINKEQKENLSNLIDKLLSINCLSDRQKDYIRLYYFEDYTFDKIGKKYGITREAVRQGLSKAIELIRSVVNG
jgi:RNA polymerase sigma factor (sigma-70 family)